MHQHEQSTGDDGSTGRVNRSPKQRAPVAPQNGDLSPQNLLKKVMQGLS